MQSQDDDKTVMGGLTLNFLYSVISEEGKQYFIEDKINIGRGTDSTILIDDKKISRNHATIAIKDGKLHMEDLNSSNGTFHNGKKVTGVVNIINGDSISFEKYVFTVKIEIKEDEVEEKPADIEEDDHTSIVEMSDEYFNKLNKAVESFEAPDTSKVPVEEKLDVSVTPEPVEPEPVQKKIVEPVAPKQAVSSDEEKKDIPSSWIEDSTPVDGTRMMDVSELNALRNSAKVVSSNESTVSRLHCFIDGQDEEIIELAISDSDEASGWEIGRDSQCDIVLDHPSVSNRHAQIVHQSGRWKMVNLVSTNGIVVNGQKKLTSYLSDGDKIGLGSVDLIFKASKSSSNNVKKSIKPVTESTSNIPVIPILLGLIFIVLAALIYFYLQK
jgi:pSer/pThr/pTyr-binding forkhead associated (FHA) protein